MNADESLLGMRCKGKRSESCTVSQPRGRCRRCSDLSLIAELYPAESCLIDCYQLVANSDGIHQWQRPMFICCVTSILHECIHEVLTCGMSAIS